MLDHIDPRTDRPSQGAGAGGPALLRWVKCGCTDLGVSNCLVKGQDRPRWGAPDTGATHKGMLPDWQPTKEKREPALSPLRCIFLHLKICYYILELSYFILLKYRMSCSSASWTSHLRAFESFPSEDFLFAEDPTEAIRAKALLNAWT